MSLFFMESRRLLKKIINFVRSLHGIVGMKRSNRSIEEFKVGRKVVKDRLKLMMKTTNFKLLFLWYLIKI